MCAANPSIISRDRLNISDPLLYVLFAPQVVTLFRVFPSYNTKLCPLSAEKKKTFLCVAIPMEASRSPLPLIGVSQRRGGKWRPDRGPSNNGAHRNDSHNPRFSGSAGGRALIANYSFSSRNFLCLLFCFFLCAEWLLCPALFATQRRKCGIGGP